MRSESERNGRARQQRIDLRFDHRKAHFDEQAEDAELVHDDGNASQEHHWIEEDRAGQVASDVVRGEPNEEQPQLDWNFRILDVLVGPQGLVVRELGLLVELLLHPAHFLVSQDPYRGNSDA